MVTVLGHSRRRRRSSWTKTTRRRWMGLERAGENSSEGGWEGKWKTWRKNSVRRSGLVPNEMLTRGVRISCGRRSGVETRAQTSKKPQNRCNKGSRCRIAEMVVKPGAKILETTLGLERQSGGDSNAGKTRIQGYSARKEPRNACKVEFRRKGIGTGLGDLVNWGSSMRRRERRGGRRRWVGSTLGRNDAISTLVAAVSAVTRNYPKNGLLGNCALEQDGADDECVEYYGRGSREDVGDDIGALLRGDGSGKSRGRTTSLKLQLGSAICDSDGDATTCGCGTNCEREDGIDNVYSAGELDGRWLWERGNRRERDELVKMWGNGAKK
ncbi:hypothetical protein C8R46DRAFT_1287667 [Mycena filopes]|nr:hypothetical protein C8R46DRAFT_1287667 [Mycena filopes]